MYRIIVFKKDIPCLITECKENGPADAIFSTMEEAMHYLDHESDTNKQYEILKINKRLKYAMRKTIADTEDFL
jgi:hypothetical protein